jgi:hypothetical protein
LFSYPILGYGRRSSLLAPVRSVCIRAFHSF